jgi:hypothetical protein
MEKLKTKTVYQKWLNEEIKNLGGFATALMISYRHADSQNREKLEKAFPEWFVVKK